MQLNLKDLNPILINPRSPTNPLDTKPVCSRPRNVNSVSSNRGHGALVVLALSLLSAQNCSGTGQVFLCEKGPFSLLAKEMALRLS